MIDDVAWRATMHKSAANCVDAAAADVDVFDANKIVVTPVARPAVAGRGNASFKRAVTDRNPNGRSAGCARMTYVLTTVSIRITCGTILMHRPTATERRTWLVSHLSDSSAWIQEVAVPLICYYPL
jgi:hypothetical protein